MTFFNRQNIAILSSNRRRKLALERLEDRIALDSNGVLLGVDPHFTLSFAADGTVIGQDISALSSTLDGIVATNEWREAILQAFQSWAIHTNADIGVVADGGQPFGVSGASQRDDRFGDIRIGATALSPEVGAVSVPVDNIASGSWLADVIFNTNFDYQSLDDVLAVALHEAGNVFGLEDNNNPNSPLFTGSSPVVNNPTAADISNLQSLHGVRADDQNEVHDLDGGPDVTDNNSFANASELKSVSANGLSEGTGPSIVYGDIRDANDVDFFQFEPPGDYSGPITITLITSGISLLQPSLSVFDDSEQLLAQSLSNQIEGSVLTVTIPEADAEGSYYLKVSGADLGVFGIGGYSIALTYDDLNVIDSAKVEEVAGGAYRQLDQEDIAELFDADDDDFINDDLGTDDEPEQGLELDTSNGFAEGTRYEIIGSIVDATDIDYYSIKSPDTTVGPLTVMTVSIQSLNAGQLIPSIQVLDDNQQIIPSQVIVNGGGQLIVQIEGVSPDTDYSVRVAAEQNTGFFDTGNYNLLVTFGTDVANLESMASGSVGGTVGQTVHTLYIGQPQLFNFSLTTSDTAVASPTAVLATIRDDQGEIVTRVASLPGQTRSAPAVLLNPGTYSAEFIIISLDSSSTPSIDYDLRGLALSDPFVGDPEDPTGNPFECVDNPGFFCYPFVPDPSPDPFLWDDFIDELATPPPELPISSLVPLLIGDWWSWYWSQDGGNGPTLTQDDRYQSAPSSGTSAETASFAAISTPPNVLDNDIDPEGGVVVALLDTEPSNGTLVLHTDGTFNYTPNPGFMGVDQFTYIAYDLTTQSLPATATIIVQIPGDYDSNGQVDDLDYATWRDNFGSENPIADGNADGVVDAADYSIWRDNLVATLLPGDYNRDGVVSMLDHTVWVNNYGTSNQEADGNQDGVVDAADYTLWRDNYNESLAQVALVQTVAATPVVSQVIATEVISTDSTIAVSRSTEPSRNATPVDTYFPPPLDQKVKDIRYSSRPHDRSALVTNEILAKQMLLQGSTSDFQERIMDIETGITEPESLIENQLYQPNDEVFADWSTLDANTLSTRHRFRSEWSRFGDH